MNYKSLRTFKKTTELFVPANGVNGKNICFYMYPENNDFFECYNFMNINKTSVRYYYVPTVKKPIMSYMKDELRSKVTDYRLRPIKGFIGEVIDKLIGDNFYLDNTDYINKILDRYNINKFNTLKSYNTIKNILQTIDAVPSNYFVRTLLYTINRDKPFDNDIRKRRIFPVIYMLNEWNRDKIELPFDQILLFDYDKDGGKFTLVFDVNEKANISRLKSYLETFQSEDIESVGDMNKDEIIDSIEKDSLINDVDIENKSKLLNIVNGYIDNKKGLMTNVNTKVANSVISKSVLNNTIGDETKVEKLSKFVSNNPENKFTKNLINTHVKKVIQQVPVKLNVNVEEFSKMANIGSLVDNEVPTHLIELRKKEFNENLQSDIISIFKTLENQDLPLKFKSMSVKIIESSIGELEKSIRDRYTITLEDDLGNEQNVHIELPHLQDNNTFLVNGMQKVLVNQIVTYPIFFFKPYSGRFESSYSSLSIHSKQMKNSSYLMIFIAGYKMPLAMLLSLQMGFDNMMGLFKLQYTILSEKKSPDAYKLPNGQYINFEIKNQVQRELIESFVKIMKYLPTDMTDINDNEMWRDIVSSFTGTRNSIHLINQIWTNIVTPIVKDVLETKGDPTEIEGIIEYISENVVRGKVDDRNDVRKLRIRISEIFTALLQKQVSSAYSEYLSKRRAGDDDATLYVNPTKIFSQVITSPNVQEFESINPLEELSMLTRITPVGVGGIPTTEAFPERARNIFWSYYGNIDPLESPEGGNIGIQQHLTVGASINNERGLFNVKDKKDINPNAILSTTPSMIPFVEKNEGARINMATGQAKQAFPLAKPEIPIVESGYETLLTPLLSDNFIKKSTIDGKITKIDKESNLIEITDGFGNIVNIDISPRVLRSGQGKNGLSIFKPVISVGDTVKKDQILAEGSNVKDGIISNGLNMLVAFMPWKGRNFEDGMVISESAAKRFVSLHYEEYNVDLEEDDDIINIAKVGDVLDKGGVLATYSRFTYDVETYKTSRCEGGRIVDIQIFNNLEKDTVPEKISTSYKSFVKRFKSLNGKYPKGTFSHRGVKIEGLRIKFVLVQELTLSKGDKLNNRYFNKGVVSIIEPDDKMPVTPWGDRIDMIYNPLSLINRMNPGQLYELHSGLIGKKLGELMISSNRKDFEKKITQVLNLLDETDGKKYSKNLITKLKSLSEVAYNKLLDKVKERKFIPLIFPPFKGSSRKAIMDALSYLGLKPEYPLRLPEFNTTTEPIAVGYMYVLKLEHISEKKIHSRSVGPYISKTLAPTGGKSRGGGAYVGEYDMYSLLAYDAPFVIDELFGPLSSDHATKNEMISDIINNGTTTFKRTKDNPVKRMFEQYMLAIHLDAE